MGNSVLFGLSMRKFSTLSSHWEKKPFGPFFSRSASSGRLSSTRSPQHRADPKTHVVTLNESISCGEPAKSRLLYKFSTNYRDAYRMQDQKGVSCCISLANPL